MNEHIKYTYFLLYKLGSTKGDFLSEYYAAILLAGYVLVPFVATYFWISLFLKTYFSISFIPSKPIIVIGVLMLFGVSIALTAGKNLHLDVLAEYNGNWDILGRKSRVKKVIFHIWPFIVFVVLFYAGVIIGNNVMGE